MLRKIRIALAAIFVIGITMMMLDFTGTWHLYLSWMAKVQLVPALLSVNVAVVALLLVLTLLLGRAYCSVVCPLGVLQDIISWLHGRKKRARTRFGYKRPLTWLRYAMLAVFAALIVGGLTAIAALIEPYSAFGRMAQSLLAPVYAAGNNVLAAVAEHYESYAFYRTEVWLKSAVTLAVAAVTLIVIAVLAWRGGRTWCNSVCPVGTLLGLLSRYSLLAPKIDTGKCTGCTLCARKCKASCINPDEHRIDLSRCVMCLDCLDNCSSGAISYGLSPRYARHNNGQHADNHTDAGNHTGNADTSRRKFIGTATMLAAGAVLANAENAVDGGLAIIQDKQKPARKHRLTPPGSQSARHLNQHCTACQLCVAACPNGVLRPSSGLATLMQPEMSYEQGYCRPECNACATVCPTSAIRTYTLPEKTSIQIGHAVWIKQNCVINTDGVSCGNCARHCPNGAIKMMPQREGDDTSPLFPVIDPERCIGCGACEYVCPARPFSAIYVEGNTSHRSV